MKGQHRADQGHRRGRREKRAGLAIRDSKGKRGQQQSDQSMSRVRIDEREKMDEKPESWTFKIQKAMKISKFT